MLMSIDDYVEFQKGSSEEEDVRCDMWLQSNKKIYPSENSKIIKECTPGFYKVLSTQNEGIFMSKEKVNTDELFTFDNDKTTALLEEVNLFWEQKEDYKKHKLIHKRGILLEGEPGTGKSSIITLLAKSIIDRGGIMFLVNDSRELDTIMSFMKLYFRKIEPNREIIIVIEGLEEINGGDKLLDLLDGKSSMNNTLIIGTVNNCEDLSTALLRPGRFDRRIHIGYPKEAIRKKYFEYKGIEGDELDKFVASSNNFSFAHLKEMLISVKLLNKNLEEIVEKLKKSGEKKNYNDEVKTSNNSFL